MNAMDEPLQTLIAEQAGEWYARRRDGDLSPAESAQFMAWLQTSPAHVREYLAAAAVARHLPAAVKGLDEDRRSLFERARQWLRRDGNVVQLHSPRAEDGISNGTARRGASRQIRRVAAAAGLALLVAGGVYWSVSPPGLAGLPRVLEVPRGEQRTVQLQDGSVVHMNADTRVSVRYSRVQRLIELEHGQAMFNVAHQSARPFIVRAGGAEVVAIGTQFDVVKRSARDLVTVTVVEGRVAVFERERTRTDARMDGAGPPATSLQLAAGQRLRLDPGGAKPRAEAVDARAATAWLRRELIFSEQRLADVAEEFSRYGVPIEIEDPALRDYRVSGVFSAYDTESFVAFLRRFGEVEQAGQVIRVRGGRVLQ